LNLEAKLIQLMEDDLKDRVISPDQFGDDAEQDITLRPGTLQEFVGQKKVVESLEIYLEAALKRDEAVDHILFSGPPGLGKTTLANIIAEYMGSNLVVTSGPALEKPSNLASLLTNLGNKDVLFIDEIHRLRSIIEEYLYPAMEDFKIDILLESGPSAKSIRLDLKKFTLVGATTRSGMLTSPLRDRFGLNFRLNTYENNELARIIKRSAAILNLEIDERGIEILSSRCRGTPRIANRILRRCRDVAEVKGDGSIDKSIAIKTLEMLGIDNVGMGEMDITLLKTIIEKFSGKPVGLSTLSAAIGEETETIEEVYEPFLIQQGFLKKTPRGRVATDRAYQHLGIAKPVSESSQEKLF